MRVHIGFHSRRDRNELDRRRGVVDDAWAIVATAAGWPGPGFEGSASVVQVRWRVRVCGSWRGARAVDVPVHAVVGGGVARPAQRVWGRCASLPSVTGLV